MKFIGQYIQSFIARFRSDVYLEDIDTGTIASGGNLGLDSNNKIVKATVSSGSGDITGVDLTGTLPITIGSETNTASGDYSSTIGINVGNGIVVDGGDLVTNDSEIDHDSLDNFSADEHFTQANITTVGTIGTGVWQGTAIATDQQKHLAYFEFEGFSVGDGTNYMIAELNSDTKAPFEHQTSTGSDGLTATGPVRLLKTAGHVMPYAGTLKLWKGWATSSGSARQTVDVGLYKATLVNDDADDISPVALKNTSFTCVGNTKPLIFSEDSFTVAFAAGDILISAIRNGTSGKRCDFSSTLVVEWN
jgi:hypothetical protein